MFKLSAETTEVLARFWFQTLMEQSAEFWTDNECILVSTLSRDLDMMADGPTKVELERLADEVLYFTPIEEAQINYDHEEELI